MTIIAYFMNVRLLFFLSLSFMVQIACSSQPTPQSTSTPDPVTQVTGPLPLWPNGAPGEPEPLGEEADATTSDDNLVAGEPLIRLANVTRPTITVYHAPEDQATGAAVVVCPGGGYHILAWIWRVPKWPHG